MVRRLRRAGGGSRIVNDDDGANLNAVFRRPEAHRFEREEELVVVKVDLGKLAEQVQQYGAETILWKV
ncbi:MAG: hypothetical protein MHM6MM_008152, partial [Cercozoa sp. M6MM]